MRDVIRIRIIKVEVPSRKFIGYVICGYAHYTGQLPIKILNIYYDYGDKKCNDILNKDTDIFVLDVNGENIIVYMINLRTKLKMFFICLYPGFNNNIDKIYCKDIMEPRYLNKINDNEKRELYKYLESHKVDETIKGAFRRDFKFRP